MISKEYKIASLVLLLKLGKQPVPLWAMQEESCTSVQLFVVRCYHLLSGEALHNPGDTCQGQPSGEV